MKFENLNFEEVLLISVYTDLLILVLTQFFSIKEKMGTFEANLTNFSNRLGTLVLNRTK